MVSATSSRAAILSAFAQLERPQLAERTRAGMIAAARRRTLRPGDGKPATVKRARDLKAQGLALDETGKIIGASRARACRYLQTESNGVI